MGFWNDALGVAGTVGTAFADMYTGGAFSNVVGQDDANKANQASADKQMDFQQYNSNSAYQRAVADMKAAGLNPMLAFQQGGASVPSGASSTSQNVRKGDIMGGLLNTGKQIASLDADLGQTRSQTNLNKANSAVADVQATKITANARESEANTRYTDQLKQKAAADTRAAKANASIQEKEADIQRARQKVDKYMAVPDAVLERIEQAIGAVTSGQGMFRRQRSYHSDNPAPRRTYTEDDMLNAAKGKGIKLP